MGEYRVLSELQIKLDESRPESLYEQIRDQLRDQILTADLPEGTPLPDLRTLSKTAGVSLRTADRAVRELVKEGICFRRPKKGTFVGKRESATTTRDIALLFCPNGAKSIHEDTVTSHLHQGVREAGAEHHVDAFLAAGDLEHAIRTYFGTPGLVLRGVLFMGHYPVPEIASLARQYPGMRFVCLNYCMKEFESTPGNVFGVFNDDFAAGYVMGAHLLQQGAQSFRFLMIEVPDEAYRLRHAGFTKALHESGLPKSASQTVMIEGIAGISEQEAFGAREAAGVLQGPLPPDAIVCVNDLLAFGVARYVNENGLADRVRVAGMDDMIVRLSLEGHFPTVDVDFEAMGRKGIEILMAKEVPSFKSLRLPPRLIAT
jgi:DNA-binding LacI/PurR family transcriptional regulator